MIPKNISQKSYWYAPHEGYESRCQRRLQKDLGIDEVAAETILHLRRQVVELQSHIRQLETELNAQIDNEKLRLARYREVYFEATWIELEFKEWQCGDSVNLEKYTQKSQQALLAAQRLAQDYHHQAVEPIHLLLALVQQEDGIVQA